MKKKNPTLRQYLIEYETNKKFAQSNCQKNGHNHQNMRKLQCYFLKIKYMLEQKIKEDQLKQVNGVLEQIKQLFKQNAQVQINKADQSIRSTKSKRAKYQKMKNSRYRSSKQKIPGTQKTKECSQSFDKQNSISFHQNSIDNGGNKFMVNTLTSGIEIKQDKKKRKIMFQLPPELNNVDLQEYQDDNIRLTNFLSRNLYNCTY